MIRLPGLAIFMLFVVELLFSIGCLQSKTDLYMRDLESANVVLQYEAMVWLGEKKKRIAVPLLKELLTNDHPRKIRVQAIRTLGKIGDRSAVDGLMAALSEIDEEILSAAVEALGRIGESKAVVPLISMLKHERVKLTAIWAMGNIADKRVVPILTSLLEDRDKFVRFNARRALKKIGDNG